MRKVGDRHRWRLNMAVDEGNGFVEVDGGMLRLRQLRKKVGMTLAEENVIVGSVGTVGSVVYEALVAGGCKGGEGGDGN